jgi:hypothetical protein
VSTQPKLAARLLPWLLRASLMALASSFAVIVAPAPVVAQDQAPLRLAIINVAGKDGDRAYDEFEEILRDSPDILLTRGAKLEDKLDTYGLSEKSLRKRELREKNRKAFIEMMRAENLEAMLVIDVYNKGRKLQVVAIGPEGEELADVQENITRGTPSRKQAVKAGDEDPDDDAVIRAQTARVRAEQKLEPGANVSVGAFFGRRAMNVQEGDAPDDFKLQHSSPFIGVGARVDGIFSTFSDGDSALGGNVFVAYAPFTTVFSTQSGQPPQELSSSYLRIGGELEFTQILSARIRLNVFAGIDRVALTIAQNSFYTGSTYLAGRGGVGVVFRFGPDAYLRAHANALPVFSADNSGGAFGESPFSVGFEGGALLRFNIINDVFIQLQYAYQRFAPEFPTPSASIAVPTTSTDQMHTGSLQVGLGF